MQCLPISRQYSTYHTYCNGFCVAFCTAGTPDGEIRNPVTSLCTSEIYSCGYNFNILRGKRNLFVVHTV
jgi:hypothetical protein